MTDITHQADQVAIRPNRQPGSDGLTWLAILALILVIMFTTQAFNSVFAAEGQHGMAPQTSVRSNPVYVLFVLFQVGLVGLLLGIHILTRPIPIRFFVGVGIAAFMLSSAAWSLDARATIVAGSIFSFQVIAAYIFATYLNPQQFIRVLFWTMAFLIVASYVMLALAPQYVTDERQDGWFFGLQFRGVLGTKNRAAMMFIAVIMISILAGFVRISLFWRIVVSIAALIGVALSSAATAVVVLVPMLLVALWMRYVRILNVEIAITVAFVYFMAMLVLPFLDFRETGIFELVGRDGGLTGRDILWELALKYFQDKPFLGHGFYGFFGTDAYSPVWNFWQHFRYFFTDKFHNSAADIAVSLGISGLVVLCIACFGAFQIVFNKSIDMASRCMIILLVHVSIVDSITNYVIFYHNSYANLFVFYAFFAAGMNYGTGRNRPEGTQQLPNPVPAARMAEAASRRSTHFR